MRRLLHERVNLLLKWQCISEDPAAGVQPAANGPRDSCYLPVPYVARYFP
jgi:hypothetical protein